MKTRRGFTLIELLVVIAIIALLMSILMPALARVKDEARAVVCRANLRQWGIAWSMAINDRNDRFISGNEVFDLIGKERRSMGFPIVDNAPYQTGICDHDHSWPAVLWTYYGDRKLLCCPTAKKEPKGVGRYDKDSGMFSAWALWTDYQNDFIYGSYGINCWVFDRGPKTLAGTWPLWRHTNQKMPELIPIMMDCFWVEGWPYDREQPPQTRYEFLADTNVNMTRFCVDRHHGRTHGLFMDLSARRIGLRGLWNLKWHPLFDINAEPVWPEWMKKFDDRIN